VLFCALVVVVALCGGVGGLGGVLPRPARRVGVLLLGALRGLGGVLGGLAGPLRDVRGGLAVPVVEIRRLVPSPDVRNGVESGPASQRGLRGALRQQQNSDKHPDKVCFAPISVTWPSWSVPRKRTSRDEALMPAMGGKRASGGAGLNTAPDP
jgi:hypothetical protein